MFKMERKLVVRALRKVNFNLNLIDQKVHQLRGLEAYSSIKFNKLMLQKRSDVIKGVMSEQARQRSLGIRDNEALRNKSCSATRWASQRGFELAKKDAEDAGHAPTWGNDSDHSAPSLCSSASESSTSTVGSAGISAAMPENFVYMSPLKMPSSPYMNSPKLF